MAEVVDPVSTARKKYGRFSLCMHAVWSSGATYLHTADGITVDEKTGIKNYPLKLQPIPRLPWEDPHADHLMTQEVIEGRWLGGIELLFLSIFVKVGNKTYKKQIYCKSGICHLYF